MIQFESNRLILREPTINDKDLVWGYRQEFIDNNDEDAFGSNEVLKSESFDAWLDRVNIHKSKDTVPEGRVPSTQFLAIRKEDGRLVGMINMRLGLTDILRVHGGHIGDSVRPTERNKGYGTEQIGLTLKYCKSIGFDKVLITCKKVNVASARTIQKNNGIKENEVTVDGVVFERYWVTL